MKVTYEFENSFDSEDSYYLRVFQRANEMHNSLLEIESYMRQLRKGYVEDCAEKIKEKISEIIFESGIGDIE